MVEINGKRYDSDSGAIVDSDMPKPVQKPQSLQGRRVRSLDGFMPAPAPATRKTHEEVAIIPVAPKPAEKSLVRATHHSPKTVNAHQPEHSKTLMRHTVKAPTIKTQKVERVQNPTDMIKRQPKVAGVKPKLSSEVVDNNRAKRASEVPRSRHVTRFQRSKASVSSAAIAAPAVQVSKPFSAPIPVPQPVEPEHPEQDMFERAIDNATSHDEPAHKESTKHKTKRGVRRHVRWVSVTAIVLAAVILGGFIMYQNKIELQLQLASAKAGFAATMPGFRPDGYAAKSLAYSPGKVAIGYVGPNNQTYKVVQKSSNWDSQTLLENFVATSGQPYDAYKASGRTVYVYGNGNATWVSGGVWYQVNDNGALSKDQIIQLANSM